MAYEENLDEEYKVLINEEEQYSLWPLWKKVPLGWKEVGPTGSKTTCLEYVKEVWTDMRPKSLRVAMEEMESKRVIEHVEPAKIVKTSSKKAQSQPKTKNIKAEKASGKKGN